MKKNKFTLVELLIVVAIIFILASLLLPVLKRARKLSIQAVCLSNLKQQGYLMHTFKSDYKGYAPLQCEQQRRQPDFGFC